MTDEPLENVETRDADRQLGQPQSKEFRERFLEWIEWQMPRLAIITGPSSDYQDDTTKDTPYPYFPDQFVVDIYDRGYFNAATKTGILVHLIDITQTFGPDPNGNWGQQIKVALLPDGTGIILPSHLPNSSGKFKVIMVGDDSFPGSWIVDYPRFS